MMKDNISHEEYRSKLANVADLAVSYINTGDGYFRMRDAFNGLAEQCGANKGINDEATVGRRKLLAQSSFSRTLPDRYSSAARYLA